jgi:aminopeptidase N
LLNNNSYEKGGWVLHMLRRKLGDSLFWQGIRAYYATYAGKNASTDDFRKIMEATAGISLKDFFQQWLYTPGHPVLKISWQYNAKKKLLQLKIIQEQKQLFYFPLELAFKNTGSTERDKKTLLIRDKITLVEIPVDAPPIQVIADPETNLLFQGKIVQEKVSRE